MYARQISRERRRELRKHPYYRAMWAFDWWRNALHLVFVAFAISFLCLVPWLIAGVAPAKDAALWFICAGVAWWIVCVLRGEHWSTKWTNAPSPYTKVGGYDG